ncbi:MAG: hypothetical protein Q8P66_02195 [Candidatus Colwellbacteria bacterium]|nr:hypothetical protein [Candidatus Colwellbacteria bacterium]
MNRRNLILLLVVILIIAGGAGYYFWNKKGISDVPDASSEGGAVSQEGPSFFDTFFEKLGSSDESKKQAGLKEYKDPTGTFRIMHPPAWIVRGEEGRLLKGASLTSPELLNQYSAEEQQFVKGLVVAAAESEETPEAYYKNLIAGAETGQTEARNLTVNDYPAYLVKGSVRGISYTIYIVSHNNRIVYFNYRSLEETSAHQNDIKRAIDFGPYLTDFEAAVNSIKFLK